jgi:hypothetical protein
VNISVCMVRRGIASEGENDSSVCVNVFGLWWSSRLLAMMESARSLPF